MKWITYLRTNGELGATHAVDVEYHKGVVITRCGQLAQKHKWQEPAEGAQACLHCVELLRQENETNNPR